MKIHVIRFRLHHDTGVATPEGGIIYDLDNKEQKEHYKEDMCILQNGYAYQISVEED